MIKEKYSKIFKIQLTLTFTFFLFLNEEPKQVSKIPHKCLYEIIILIKIPTNIALS